MLQTTLIKKNLQRSISTRLLCKITRSKTLVEMIAKSLKKTSVFPVVRSLFGGGMPLYIELAYAKGCKRNHLMWEISHSPHITKNHFVVLQCLATCQSLPCELLIPKAGSVATSATAIASES